MTDHHTYVPGLWCAHVIEAPSDAEPLGVVCGQPASHPDHEATR